MKGMENLVLLTPAEHRESHRITTACTGSTIGNLSRDELRAIAWTNFYRAERRLGVTPERAYERAEAHARRCDEIFANIDRAISED